MHGGQLVAFNADAFGAAQPLHLPRRYAIEHVDVAIEKRVDGGIVIGASKALPAGLDLDGIPGHLSRNGTLEMSGKTDDPMGALAWLANLAVERKRPMKAGMVVITGSVVTTVDIAPGERLDFVLDGVGSTSMTAA